MKQMIFIAWIFLTNVLFAQLPKKVLNSFEKSTQIEYKTREWVINDNSKDTNFYKSSQHFVSFVSSDTLVNAFFKFDQTNNSIIYNGVECIWIDKITKNATVVNLTETPIWKNTNVKYYNSFIEIYKVLKEAIHNKDYITSISEREIKITLRDREYYESKIDSGVTTVYVIKLPTNSLYPNSLTVQSLKNGKIILNKGVFFSNIELKNISADYSTKSIDPSIDIIKHKWIDMIKVGDTIPNWSVFSMNKEKFLLKELCKESNLLIELWSTSCRYCIVSIPKLNELYQKYDNKQLKIIYANGYYESFEAIEAFAKKHSTKFGLYKFGNIIEHGAFPSFFLVDRQGIIKYISLGYPEDLSDEIELFIKNAKN